MRAIYLVILSCLSLTLLPGPSFANPMKGVCRPYYREYLKTPKYRSFATRNDKRACARVHGFKSQAKADAAALKNCRKYGKCYILTNTTYEAKARAKAKAKAKAKARSKTATAKRVQTALNGLGFNVGTVDGNIGPATRAQIKRFQKSIGRSSTGLLTSQERTTLFKKDSYRKKKQVKTIVFIKTFENSKGYDTFAVNSLRHTVAGVDTGTAVTLWDVSSGKTIIRTTGLIIAAALDGPAKNLVFSDEKKPIQILDLTDGSISDLDIGIGATAVALNQDGSMVAFGDRLGQLKVMDVMTRQIRFSTELGAAISKVRFDPKGKALVALTQEGAMKAIATNDGQPMTAYLSANPGGATDFQFSIRGKYIVIGYASGRVRSYERSSDRFELRAETTMARRVEAIDVHEQGEVLAVSSRKATVLNVETLKTIIYQSKHYKKTTPVKIAFFTPKNQLIIPSFTGYVALNARNGKEAIEHRNRGGGYKKVAAARTRNATKALRTAKAKQRKLQAQAAALFVARDCVGFGQTAKSNRAAKTLKECEQLKAEEAQATSVRKALSAKKCDLAEQLDTTKKFTPKVTQCRYALQLLADKSALKLAMETGECGVVARLAPKLGESGKEELCKYNSVMASDNARPMFLAAATYEAKGNRDTAKLIYLEIMKRFPEDDLAIQAATRLTTISDIAANAAKQRQLEAQATKAKVAAAAERTKKAARERAKKAASDRALRQKHDRMTRELARVVNELAVGTIVYTCHKQTFWLPPIKYYEPCEAIVTQVLGNRYRVERTKTCLGNYSGQSFITTKDRLFSRAQLKKVKKGYGKGLGCDPKFFR